MADIYLLPMLLAENSHNKALTPEALFHLKRIKVLFVENLKTTRRFLSSLKAGIIIDEIRFIEMSEKEDITHLYTLLVELDQDAGIISEAGCAGVADPGAFVVEVAHQVGLRVVPLVGPSSILLALMASGFNGQSFVFHGYLPIKEDEKSKKLKQIDRDSSQKKQTQIFIETPYRNNQMLQSIIKHVNPQTKLCVACDINSENEYIKTKSIAAWASKNLPDLNKRPTVFLLG
jgi:16S rRNA (cytidine1402-2'-O)-methyltransferase